MTPAASRTFHCDLPAAAAVPGSCVELTANGAGDVRVLCNSTASWSEARTTCAGFGGDLSILYSRAEHVALLADLEALGFTIELWLGASDIDSEGDWVWIDGTPLPAPYSDWKSGEPNNDNGEDCLEMQGSSGVWNDDDCDATQSYACEAPLNASLPQCASFPRTTDTLLVCTDNRTYDAAQLACASVSGALVRIDTPAEDAEVAAAIGTRSAGNTWLGGSDLGDEGVWRWTDGARFELIP
jgi:Lectin C-type domain